MTLPSSGTLSLLDIQGEFGGSNPIGINEYYGVATGVPSSGTIAVSNFYGTSAVITITYSSNTGTAQNIGTLAQNAGWDGSSDVNIAVVVNSNVYVYSNSTGSYTMQFPAVSSGSTVTLTNNGYIYGRGADADSGCIQVPWSVPNGEGNQGGNAIYAPSNARLNITNNGTIAGGGGSGGAGWQCWGTGGGGGGGAPYGAGGIQTCSDAGGQGGNGSNATLTTGGAGGAGSASYNDGGDGGNPGYAGAVGYTNYGCGGRQAQTVAGGAAGNYIVGNANVTWSTNGTRLGGSS